MLNEIVVGIRASSGSCLQVERMADCGDGVGSRNNGNGTHLRNSEHPEGGAQGPGSPHMPATQAVPDGVDADAARPDDDYEEDSVEFKLGAIYQLIEGKRLCFAVHKNDEETLRDIKRFPRLFFFSSDLQVAVTRPPYTSPHHGLASRHILGLILVEPGHDGPSVWLPDATCLARIGAALRPHLRAQAQESACPGVLRRFRARNGGWGSQMFAFGVFC